MTFVLQIILYVNTCFKTRMGLSVPRQHNVCSVQNKTEPNPSKMNRYITIMCVYADAFLKIQRGHSENASK